MFTLDILPYTIFVLAQSFIRLLNVNRLQRNLAATRRDDSLEIAVQVEQLRRIVVPVAN